MALASELLRPEIVKYWAKRPAMDAKNTNIKSDKEGSRAIKIYGIKRNNKHKKENQN